MLIRHIFANGEYGLIVGMFKSMSCELNFPPFQVLSFYNEIIQQDHINLNYRHYGHKQLKRES